MARVSANKVSMLIKFVKSLLEGNAREDVRTLIRITHNDNQSWILCEKCHSASPEDPAILIDIAHNEVESWIQSVDFYQRYHLTRNLDDLQQAVTCARAVVGLADPATIIAPPLLFNLARPLLRRFQQTRQVEDISEAIQLFRDASQMLTHESPMGQQMFRYLSLAYLERDGNLDGLLALDNEPDVYSRERPSFEKITESLDEKDEVFFYFVDTYVSRDHARVLHSSDSQDLKSEIQICRQALDYFRPDPAKTGAILTQLGWLLLRKQAGDLRIEDIDEAIKCCCDAAELLPRTSGVFWFSIFCSSVLFASMAYEDHFLFLGKRQDLDDAFRFAKEAMKVFSPQHPRFVLCIASMARLMGHRYQATGDLNDLEAAIEFSSRAVAMGERSEGDCSLNGLLYDLAQKLLCRSLVNNRAEDISEAIDAAQRSVDVTAPGDPKLGGLLAKLSDCEFWQFQKLKDPNYLERALQHSAQSRSIRKEAHDYYCKADQAILDSVNFILPQFRDDFCSEMNPEHLDRVIATARHGTSLATEGHGIPQVVGSYNIFLYALFARWERTHEKEDIDEAIHAAQCMMELAKGTATLSVTARRYLGEFLYNRSRDNRYESTRDGEDRDKALEVLLEAFRMPAAVLRVRIDAGQIAVQILSDLADWDAARRLCREIIDLRSIQNDRSLSWQDKQYWLRQYSRHIATYASIALEAGSDVYDVIDILESCRGSILGHLIDSQTDLDDLAEVAPEKATLFRTLLNEINTPIHPADNTESRVNQTTRRIQAEGEIRACLQDIRMLEGFDHFLLGPTKEEIQTAAARGPIIIVIITLDRSNAIIITKNGSDVLALPKLEHQKVKEYVDVDLTNCTPLDIGRKNKKFRKLQEWLWYNCVKLIFRRLEDLGYGPEKFHVWWIPIGIANSLPFHAAGIYTPSGNESETALSRAISSYTPTLKVLLHGRRKLKDDFSQPEVDHSTSKPEILKPKPRLVVITMPSTPGRSNLEGVEREAKEIQKMVSDNYSIQILRQPSVEETMENLPNCEIMHFACHGESTAPDPSSSHLLLQAKAPNSDMPAVDKLTLRDVATANVSNGKLAFLSACSTAQIKFTELWDEVLHLAAGIHVAGYLHVIGNLWPSDDAVSVELVRGFYHHLVADGWLGDGDNIAKALNKAMTDVAKQYAQQPLCWAQFVHFGV